MSFCHLEASKIEAKGDKCSKTEYDLVGFTTVIVSTYCSSNSVPKFQIVTFLSI